MLINCPSLWDERMIEESKNCV